MDTSPKQRPVSTDGMEDLILRLSMARGVEEIMALVRQSARSLTGADGVTFVLRDNDKCYYADEDAIAPLWKGQRFPMETCISGWAMNHAEVVVIEDIYKDNRIPHEAYRPTFVKSLAMAPVREEDPVGAIGAYWAKAECPSAEAIHLLQRIAHSTAVAMTNVALINSLAAAKEEAARARDAMILAMASLAETRDTETGNHIRRTQHYVRALAEALKEHEPYSEHFSDDVIDLLYKSAPLHDIGKVGIPDSILLKPGKLEPEEYEVMKTHAELGRTAIAAAERYMGSTTPFLSLAKEIAHTHHEKWNGTGYPQGLRGEDIPIGGRIMAIADVYDALVSERIYKPAMPHDDAVDLILREAGRHFDPGLVNVFATIAPKFREIHRQFADAA
ncbi:response regulator RpfG family c-di-GMP phosphodiesterase [Rhizobium petrolearium]|uniref:HD domain-containing phosphohydrolase n=1 Tax=Neorhizobium petrolearium TaxID=515361 RepID=UPI001AE33144|nr:HD domain-containing phosphohydrolase [Neorhizobium petrolearium]MBP1843561.1 response regulator RpfG family c-di-GMP phosphodiesterase [Neorhizobium petrolearium]